MKVIGFLISLLFVAFVSGSTQVCQESSSFLDNLQTSCSSGCDAFDDGECMQSLNQLAIYFKDNKCSCEENCVEIVKNAHSDRLECLKQQQNSDLAAVEESEESDEEDEEPIEENEEVESQEDEEDDDEEEDESEDDEDLDEEEFDEEDEDDEDEDDEDEEEDDEEEEDEEEDEDLEELNKSSSGASSLTSFGSLLLPVLVVLKFYLF